MSAAATYCPREQARRALVCARRGHDVSIYWRRNSAHGGSIYVGWCAWCGNEVAEDSQ